MLPAVNHSIFSLRQGNDVTKLLAASYWIWALLLRMLLLYADAVFGVSSIHCPQSRSSGELRRNCYLARYLVLSVLVRA